MEKVVFSAELPGVQVEQMQRSGPFTMHVAHAHAFWELYYLLDGECVYFMDGKSYALKPGAFVFIGTNCLHRTVAGGHERIWVGLDPSSLAAYELPAMLEADRSVVIQLPPEARRRMEMFLSCLTECLAAKADGYAERAKLYLLCLITYAGEQAHTAAESAEHALSPRHKQAESVIRYLEEHYQQKIQLDEIANELYISKYHLSHAFKQVTGVTIVDYLSAVRMRHARYMLATKNIRVAEVAERAGFQSLSHFNRTFRSQTGMTPLQYRKSLSKKKEG